MRRRPARGEVLTDRHSGGQLVVVATPIGNLDDLPPRAAKALASADLLCCEDTRHTGRLLANLGITAARLVSLHAHNESARIPEILATIADGATVALCSDAGTPLVSDPGARLVAAAIERGLPVTTVPGASAVLAALVVSGFAGRFSFEGFLPRKGPERRQRLAVLAVAELPTVVFEAPGRVAATLSDLVSHCDGTRRVAICRELTKLHEEVFRGTLDEALGARLVVEPRGEYVIVLEAAPAVEEAVDDLAPALRELLASHMSVRDAVRAVEVLRGVGHREAYAAAVTVAAELAARQGDDDA